MEVEKLSVTNVFAIFYVVAQVIERLLETLKNGLGTYDKDKAEIETANVKIENQKKIIEKIRTDGGDLTEHYEKLKKDIMTKNKMDNKMVWQFFMLASGLGIVAAYYLNLSFLSLLEVKVHPAWDILITGLVIGSGTKPLHDLITYIQKAKE